MLATLRQRNFALLWFGGLISFAGDWALIIALPVFVYDLTGSTLATGAMFIIQILPRVLLAPVAGVFVDRWDRKRVMVISDIIRGVILLSLGILAVVMRERITTLAERFSDWEA